MEIIKYNEILNRQKHLLCFSIVKMKGPYREFEKYTRALDKLLKHTHNNPYGFDRRVYFDDSCHKEIKELINRFKDVEFFKFNYPKLRIGEFHDGTFGSLVRILPIFEQEKNNKNQHNYEYVWIDDIDILPSNLDLNYINLKQIRNFNTLFLSIFCYKRPWIHIDNKYNMNFPLVTNIKLDINIFNKFIEDLANNKYQDVVTKILKFRPDRYKYDYPVRHPYGMDEYFTNFIIYNDLCRYNTYVIYQIDISQTLKSFYYLPNIDIKNKEIINALLELQTLVYKSDDIKIKTNINNTYIKMFNKLKLEDLYLIIDDFKADCIKEYLEFLNKHEMKDINQFKLFLKIN
jgi:hypothetical protein